MGARTTSTGSPWSTTTGGSTCVRATRSRCCGSTWKPPTSPPASSGRTKSSRSSAARQTEPAECLNEQPAECLNEQPAECLNEQPAECLNEQPAECLNEQDENAPRERETSVALDPKLLEILACPEDKGPLLYFEDESSLYNPRLQRRYRVEDDIPIMLIDEAETVDDGEHARLLAKAEADGIQPTFAA